MSGEKKLTRADLERMGLAHPDLSTHGAAGESMTPRQAAMRRAAPALYEALKALADDCQPSPNHRRVPDEGRLRAAPRSSLSSRREREVSEPEERLLSPVEQIEQARAKRLASLAADVESPERREQLQKRLNGLTHAVNEYEIGAREFCLAAIDETLDYIVDCRSELSACREQVTKLEEMLEDANYRLGGPRHLPPSPSP